MRLVLTGDVMLGRLVNQVLRSAHQGYPWGDLLPVFQQADWRFCNLECVISDIVPLVLPSKVFHFRSDARNVAVLKAAGIDVVSTANNHSLDFGTDAMLDMLQILEQAGVGYAGSGRDVAQASHPAISLLPGGTRIGVIAATDNEPSWAAGPDRPGVYNFTVASERSAGDSLAKKVRALRAQTDLAIVSLHWGSNQGIDPEPGQRELARALIQAGASVVFGHSSHVFRGIEVYQGAPIFYSAGDFIDDYYVDELEHNDWALIYELNASGSTVTQIRLRPVVIEDCQARMAAPAEANRVFAAMQSRCAGLGTQLLVRGLEAEIEVTASQEVCGHAHGASRC
jgi:poly-gamma-glutamate capsule biosynthesis protein CapA/YwtB (metallophosphatase superfamily)